MRYALALVMMLLLSRAVDAAEKWQPVPPPDFSKIKPDDFRDDELDLPYYLSIFPDLANSIVEEGPDRGFVGGVFWRGEGGHKTYNARVMENHLSVAFFYCTDRPWNVYRGSLAVRQRLKAMLIRLCDMQNDDGRFSEYGAKQWNLPATAFFTKFAGETLTLLKKNNVPFDAPLLERFKQADRKALLATFTSKDMYEHGKRYTNQYENAFAGAAAYLALFGPDEEIDRLLIHQLADAEKDFQSPCGYFYEADGPDFGYTLHTHHSDVTMTYFYLRGTSIGDALEWADTRWNEWLGYNLLRQPRGGDGAGTFVINRSIETRQKHATWDRQDGPFAEKVAEARAFASSVEERHAEIARQRERLKKQWGGKLDKPEGEEKFAFSPYVVLHRDHPAWYPTQAQRDEAVSKLPYLARDRFVHQCVDSRKPAVYTFIRRPLYYATFSSGPQITPQQRLGLGIVWSPRVGALFQSQTGSDDHAWGTRANDSPNVYEAGEVNAKFTIGQQALTPVVGNTDLPAAGDLTVRYPLAHGGSKTISFSDDVITVHVEHPGLFTEQVPQLCGKVGHVVISTEDHGPMDADPQAVARLAYDKNASAGGITGPAVFQGNPLYTTRLSARDSLTYRILFLHPPK